MEQRRFCAKCNAPEVKGSDVCVLCGGTDFLLPQKETPVKVVEIEDATVKAPVESKFIRNSEDDTVTPFAEEMAQVSSEAFQEQAPEKPDDAPDEKPERMKTPVIPDEERTIVYKSFAEYEKELAEKGIEEDDEDKKKKKKSKHSAKNILLVFLCILLSLLLVAGGFVAGVYLTYTGALDQVLPALEPKIDEEYQTEIDTCNTYKTELAGTLLDYVTGNGVYIEETVTIVIECVDDADFCMVTVDDDCLSEEEIENLLGGNYMCPTRGTYVAKIIPFEDEDGNGKLRVEVTCDGESGGYQHS